MINPVQSSITLVSPYLLFAGTAFYAAPGWDCFRGGYLTQKDASNAIHEKRIRRRTNRDFDYGDGELEQYSECIDWYQIIDLEFLRVVEHGGHGYGEDERLNPVEFKGYTLEVVD